MMIDTHCHLLKDEYENIEQVIKNMNGNIMVASGANDEYNHSVIDIIKKYSNIYGTIGLHPDMADSYTSEQIEYIENNINNSKIVGIGEIGLDYHNEVNHELQKELFILQLNLARKYNKPVVIHSRDAANDTFNILKQYSDLHILIHCYSYSLEMAKQFEKIGCIFGIGGVITFKNGKKLREVVDYLPMNKIVLETDSPCLSPEPYRGKTNQPYNITIVAHKISELKGVSIEEIFKETTINAQRIYNLQ